MIPLLTSVAIMEPTKNGPASKLQCDVSSEHILGGVVEALEHFVSAADGLASDEIPPTIFDGGDLESQISIRDYLLHIAKAGLCSKECFIIALVYAERLLEKQENFTLSRKNVHRFMLVSIMIASKILDDFYCRNVFYAKAGGLSVDAINDLELQMVFMLDFVLQVQPEEFALYRDSLRREDIRQLSSAVPAFNTGMSPTLSPIAMPFEQGQTWMVSVPPPPTKQMQRQCFKGPISTVQHPILCHSVSTDESILQHHTHISSSSFSSLMPQPHGPVHQQLYHQPHFSHDQFHPSFVDPYTEVPVMAPQWFHSGPATSQWSTPHGIIGQTALHQQSGLVHDQRFSSRFGGYGFPVAQKHGGQDYSSGLCRPAVVTSFPSQFCPTTVPIGWCA
eukprot:m.335059 g.335059  ORF g.335059 m.335059 type:complete len:391 (-) comp20521_c0_seq1:228-1400(-)